MSYQGDNILLDSGMSPKEEGPEAVADTNQTRDLHLEAAVITHAHLDHVGGLPTMLRQHSEARAFMTAPTASLAEALLHNSVNVMSSKRLEHGITEYPLFTHSEVEEQMFRWEARSYKETFNLTEHINATFYDAGHVLGSASVLLEAGGKRVLYTGDVQFDDQSLILGADLPEEIELDALIMETTRGNRGRDPKFTRANEESRLAARIQNIFDQGGSVLIPVFAMGKTQELMTMLQRFKDDNLINKEAPIHIGGLSTKMTMLYDAFAKESRRSRPGFQILRDMDLIGTKKTKRNRTREPIPYHPGRIYALSSGMMTAKTISNQFARGFLSNPNNGLFFVGYADPEEPGGKIKAASRGDVIKLDRSHPGEALLCEVEDFDFSGHAPRGQLLEYACKVKPNKIFLVHGDTESKAWFKEELSKRLPDTQIFIPEFEAEYEV